MSAKRKLVLGYSPHGMMGGSIHPFESIFGDTKNIEMGMDGIDALVLWGGTDIHPSFYRQSHHPKNYAPVVPTKRDMLEYKAMLYCKTHDIPMVGICRGAQFGCVFAGGSLAQHVERHDGNDHLIKLQSGDMVWSNSVHHQMMNPYTNKVPHELLGWTAHRTNTVYEDGDGDPILAMKNNPEPEIVWFPEIRFLGIQGHPEYLGAPHQFKELAVELVKKYVLNGEVK